MERDSHQFIGQSSAFLDAVERASRAAPLNRPVLVVGERGTGKELIAERLHRLSSRWDGPLVTINCAALPETLIEAELFGHEAGAFTGATRAREGRFEEADGGTLFLDELGTLSMGAQERLLRAVEYGEVTRIGSSRPMRVDVRIVAATNEHLPNMVDKGRFRADLLDRLCFEVITLPPLRVREGDVEVLSEYYGRRMAAELGWAGCRVSARLRPRPLKTICGPAMCANCATWSNVPFIAGLTPAQPVDYIQFDPFDSPWRGGLAASAPAQVRSDNQAANAEPRVANDLSQAVDVTDFREATEKYEKAVLEQALAKCRYNQRQTAKALNLSYDQLRHTLKKHDLLG
jgi:psp operon transcriptional activator